MSPLRPEISTAYEAVPAYELIIRQPLAPEALKTDVMVAGVRNPRASEMAVLLNRVLVGREPLDLTERVVPTENAEDLLRHADEHGLESLRFRLRVEGLDPDSFRYEFETLLPQLPGEFPLRQVRAYRPSHNQFKKVSR